MGEVAGLSYRRMNVGIMPSQRQTCLLWAFWRHWHWDSGFQIAVKILAGSSFLMNPNDLISKCEFRISSLKTINKKHEMVEELVVV